METNDYLDEAFHQNSSNTGQVVVCGYLPEAQYK